MDNDTTRSIRFRNGYPLDDKEVIELFHGTDVLGDQTGGYRRM